MSFKDLALPMAKMGVPVIRLMPKSKIAIDKGWQDLATTDEAKILAWDSETPNCNAACVAKNDSVCFLETDRPGGGVIAEYEQETGEKFKTFTVSSSPGHFHFYFKQTDASRALGALVQGPGGIPFGSFRQHNAYVVAPGSIHPETGKPYRVMIDAPIIPIPDSLINWLRSKIQGKQEKPATADGPRQLVPHGFIHAAITSEAGRLRKFGYEPEAIRSALLDWAHANCEPPLDDKRIEQVALSMANYKPEDPRLNEFVKVDKDVEIIPAGTDVAAEEVVQETFEYPYWCWNGTLYEDYALLAGEGNVIPKEFFIEAVKAYVGAICGHRVLPFVNPDQEARFYTILIAPAGSGKSTATKWTREMFAGTGLVYDLGQAGGYTNVGCAIGSFASSTGLIKSGFTKHDRLLMAYDEASTLVEKFGITGSGDSFLDIVNQVYESGAVPQLATKETKEIISKIVHTSIIGCTTKEKWAAAFTKTNAESSGFFQRLNIISNESDETVPELKKPDLSILRDRFIKKIQPLEYQQVVVQKDEDALTYLKEWYEAKKAEWKSLPADVTGRLQVLVQRNASHLAWMMAGDHTPNPEAKDPIIVECDRDIMERACALADYEVMARMSHQPAAGRNEHAVVENLIKGTLGVKKRMTRNHLYDMIHAERFGIRIFDGAVQNLVHEGFIKVAKIENEKKRGRKGLIIEWVGSEE
jgi:Bifunctional DNA primase/polymerase, N-terminal/Primase C terminal 1 (PriCT-1)